LERDLLHSAKPFPNTSLGSWARSAGGRDIRDSRWRVAGTRRPFSACSGPPNPVIHRSLGSLANPQRTGCGCFTKSIPWRRRQKELPAPSALLPEGPLGAKTRLLILGLAFSLPLPEGRKPIFLSNARLNCVRFILLPSAPPLSPPRLNSPQEDERTLGSLIESSGESRPPPFCRVIQIFYSRVLLLSFANP